MQNALADLDRAQPDIIYHFPIAMEVLKDYPAVNPDDFRAEMDWFDQQIRVRYSLQKQVGRVEILRHRVGRLRGIE